MQAWCHDAASATRQGYRRRELGFREVGAERCCCASPKLSGVPKAPPGEGCNVPNSPPGEAAWDAGAGDMPNVVVVYPAPAAAASRDGADSGRPGALDKPGAGHTSHAPYRTV